jgi:hypothetical protein
MIPSGQERKMTMKISAIMVSLLLVFLGLALTGCGGGKEDDNRGPTVNVTGSWEGNWESADNSGIFNFVMTQIGNDVEGMNTRLGRFTGNVQANILYIDGTDLYGVVEGNNIAGVYTGNNGEVVTFQVQRQSGIDFVDL